MTHAAAPRIAIASGIPRLDRFLETDYENVLGMSSRFAAAITGFILRHQSAQGVIGDVAEIGTFKGRFFIAMMMGLKPGERGLGIDTFDWPTTACWDEFLANCDAQGIARADYTAWKTDTRGMSVGDLKAKLGGRSVRFFHIDGDHSDVCLAKDLELATAVMHPQGVICLDDMLHPGYPTLVATVMRYLDQHSDMRVFLVIDREDIVAAPKFCLCRADAVPLYEEPLMAEYQRFQYILGADFLDHGAVVLTPSPRLAKVD